MDSGTSDGSDQDELARVLTYGNGNNQNQSVTQLSPTSRAEQMMNALISGKNPAVQLLPMAGPDGQSPSLVTTPFGPQSVAGGPAFVPLGSVVGRAGPGNGFGDKLSKLQRDAQDRMRELYEGTKRELGLLPGTIRALPEAFLGSLVDGQAPDSVQGMIKGSEVLGGGIAQLLPDEPVFGNLEQFNQGKNVLGPLADEAFFRATIGKVLGPLACLGGRAGRLVRIALRLMKLGYGAKGVYDSLQSLKTAIENGDSAGVVASLIRLVARRCAIFGGGCFAAGTPILTLQGSKLIEDIRPGDWVITAPDDDSDAEPVPRQVEEVFENYLPLLDISVGGWTIRTTAEHPFWVKGRGWVAAQQLEAGHELRTRNRGWVRVDGLEGPKPSEPVYNMCVADYHTYFVGHQIWGFSVWSHNIGARGCRNAKVRGAVNRGNQVHYDQLNGATGQQLPSALKQKYPDTEFDFKRRGQPGPDATVKGGTHPSQYPGSSWNPGNNFGDFKPDTQSGGSKFRGEIKSGKLPRNTEMLPYNPQNGKPSF